MPVHPAAVKDLFLQAVVVADPAARDALLRKRCGEDAELLARVNALLAADVETQASGAAGGSGTDGSSMLDETQDAPQAMTSVDPASSQERDGSTIAGRYTLQEKLGEGGMGSVYRAEQTRPVRRQVALKLIKLGMDSKAVVARFDAERQALAIMDHPNIA